MFFFFSKTQGLWFYGFWGTFTGFLIVLAISSTLLFNRNSRISKGDLALFLCFLIVLFLSVVFSEKILTGNRDAIRKFLLLFPNVVVPGFWGILFRKEFVKEKYLYKISLALILLGNFLLYHHYSSLTLSFFRVGTESNSTYLSYGFANLWLFVLIYLLFKDKFLSAVLVSIVALSNVFSLASRQPVVYLLLVITILWIMWAQPFKLDIPNKGISFSIRKFKILVIFFSALFLFSLIIPPIANEIGKNKTFKTAFDSAFMRWSAYIESDYSDEARKTYSIKALKIWEEYPLLGNFSYESLGTYAHNMPIDTLAQYGLLGGFAYFPLVVFASYNCIRDSKESVLMLALSLMFLGQLFIGMLVTTLVTNPLFHFLLFFWVANRNQTSLALTISATSYSAPHNRQTKSKTG